MVRAAGLGRGGGWVLHLPLSKKHTGGERQEISKAEAEEEFGADIPESAWHSICLAFKRHGMRLDELEGTRDNRNKNDARGWHKRKQDAEKGLRAALRGLDRINRDFLAEAEDLVSLNLSGGLESYGCLGRLDKAMEEILFLSLMMREAEPLSRDIMTEAQSRQKLARDVFSALEGFGATLSNGRDIGQREPSYADLTGFERLAELLEIHQGDTPLATAKWLRDAMAQDR